MTIIFIVFLMLLVLTLLYSKNTTIITIKNKRKLLVYDEEDRGYLLLNPTTYDYQNIKIGHTYKIDTYLFRIIYAFEEI